MSKKTPLPNQMASSQSSTSSELVKIITNVTNASSQSSISTPDILLNNVDELRSDSMNDNDDSSIQMSSKSDTDSDFEPGRSSHKKKSKRRSVKRSWQRDFTTNSNDSTNSTNQHSTESNVTVASTSSANTTLSRPNQHQTLGENINVVNTSTTTTMTTTATSTDNSIGPSTSNSAANNTNNDDEYEPPVKRRSKQSRIKNEVNENESAARSSTKRTGPRPPPKLRQPLPPKSATRRLTDCRRGNGVKQSDIVVEETKSKRNRPDVQSTVPTVDDDEMEEIVEAKASIDDQIKALRKHPIIPVKEFFHYDTLSDLKYVNRIENSSYDEKSSSMQYEVLDVDLYGKRKKYQHMTKEALRQSQEVVDEFAQYREETNENVDKLFYVGNHSFVVVTSEFKAKFAKIISDLSNKQFLIYQSNISYQAYDTQNTAKENEELRLRNSFNRNNFTFNYERDDLGYLCRMYHKHNQTTQYYIYVHDNSYKSEVYKMHIDSDPLNETIMYLFNSGAIKLKIESFEKMSSSVGNFKLNVSIYIGSKLVIQDTNYDPSRILSNRHGNEMQTLMQSFIFSKQKSTVPTMSKSSTSMHLTNNRRDKYESMSDDVLVDEQDICTKHEDLFDIVHELHKSNKKINTICDYELDYVQENCNLKPLLRPYQIKAVKWMLKRENVTLNIKSNVVMDVQKNSRGSKNKESEEDDDEDDDDDDENNTESLIDGETEKENANAKQIDSDSDDDMDTLHPLYMQVKNSKGQTAYYHKYHDLICFEKPLRIKSESGGILADEMGLGKTLEMLALILMNPRVDFSAVQSNEDFESSGIEVYDELITNKNKTKVSKVEIKKPTKEVFSCICNDTPDYFQLLQPSTKYKPVLDEHNIYQCKRCKVYSHRRCLNYKGLKENFYCMQCCTKIPPVPAKATLIVTPSVISYQWAEEIKKHVNKKMNILIYKGTQSGFIQPTDLANFDVVITTYDVLSNELSYVFAIENMKVLRNPRRYMTTPSPITCVNWWRICLDEAQMVHSTNSRCAEMANRLSAVNRWCVTGTPIGRSLDDLHGLFTFIREDPYYEKKWFNKVLYEPYQNNCKMPLAQAISRVLWRTAKKHVEDQINIPKQTEKLYWLEFSPFEKHLYERVLESFRANRARSIVENDRQLERMQHAYRQMVASAMEHELDNNESHAYPTATTNNLLFNTTNDNLRIDELDRSKLSQLLSPFYNLRLTCSHPMLVMQQRTFMPQQIHGPKVHCECPFVNAKSNKKKHKKDCPNYKKLFSMEKCGILMMKKTQAECENHFRNVTMNMNALAGLNIILKNYSEAVQLYQKSLDAEANYENHVRLDLLQKIHIYHNYAQALKMMQNDATMEAAKMKEIEDKVTSFEGLLKNDEKIYMANFDDKKKVSEDEARKLNNVIELAIKEKKVSKDYETWWFKALDTIESANKEKREDFWARLNIEFNTMHLDFVLAENDPFTICGKRVKSFDELKYVIVQEMDQLFVEREKFVKKLEKFYDDREDEENKSSIKTSREEKLKHLGVTSEMVRHAADCHLRREMLIAQNISKQQIPAYVGPKCDLCVSDLEFPKYGKFLFSNANDIIKSSMQSKEKKSKANMSFEDDEDDDREENNEQYENAADELNVQLHSTRARNSNLESFFKIVYNFIRNERSLASEATIGKEFLEFFQKLKEEFKKFRTFWLKVSNQVNAYDELEMAKIRMRLREPSEKNAYNLNYIIEPSLVYESIRKHNNDKAVAEIDLKKKLGQLLFLRNLQKTHTLKDGEENMEICPICQHELGFDWMVLACGHSFCLECFDELLKNNEWSGYLNAASNNNSKNRKLRCALCREISTKEEAFLVSTKREELEKPVDIPIEQPDTEPKVVYQNDFSKELSNIKIKGQCNSAKVEGIVKCLLNITRKDRFAKCIVFSENPLILELIISLMKDNNLTYHYAKDSASLQKHINEFKKNLNINVLLMPFSSGASGLNIIEATHVLLVEPTLNKGQEVQAIGRVHRIGQTKPTFVYRFMIKNTIEELVFDLFKSAYPSSHIDTNGSNDSGASRPGCSKDFDNQDSADLNTKKTQQKILTIGEIKKLYHNL